MREKAITRTIQTTKVSYYEVAADETGVKTSETKEMLLVGKLSKEEAGREISRIFPEEITIPVSVEVTEKTYSMSIMYFIENAKVVEPKENETAATQPNI
jgi:hypothetical protein